MFERLLLSVRQPRYLQYSLSSLLSLFLGGHPDLQNLISCEQILSFAWLLANASKRSALAGSTALMACTNFSVSPECTAATSQGFFSGALDRVSAVYKDFQTS